MRLTALLLVVCVTAIGCGNEPNHFFKPEISGAVYAAPQTPAAEVSKLTVGNHCYWVGMGIGWTCTNEIITDGQVWSIVDDDRYLAAPKFKPINSVSRAVTGDPTADE